jgi:hypothetical protein
VAVITIHFICSTIFEYLPSVENPVEWFVGNSIANASNANPMPGLEKTGYMKGGSASGRLPQEEIYLCPKSS